MLKRTKHYRRIIDNHLNQNTQIINIKPAAAHRTMTV